MEQQTNPTAQAAASDENPAQIAPEEGEAVPEADQDVEPVDTRQGIHDSINAAGAALAVARGFPGLGPVVLVLEHQQRALMDMVGAAE